MKTISEQSLPVLVEDILNTEKEIAETTNKKFNGITGRELFEKVSSRLGDDWMVDTSRPKLSKHDVNAIANARFFKQTGQKLLMGLAIIILGLSVVMRYIHLTALYTNIYYTVCGVIALGFIYIYSKKQSKVRHEIGWQFGVKDDTEEVKTAKK